MKPNQAETKDRIARSLDLSAVLDGITAYDWDIQTGTVQVKGPLQESETVFDRAFIDSLMHPDDRSRSIGQMNADLKKKGRFETEVRMLTGPGKYTWIRDCGRLMETDKKGNRKIRGFLTDISAYKESLETLRNENILLREGLRQSDEINNAILKGLEGFAHVRYLDQELRIHWDNNEWDNNEPTLDRFSQKNLSALMHCYEVTHGKSNRCTDCPVMDALTTGTQQERENTLEDGQSYMRRCNPVRDAAGAVLGIIHIALNVTKHRQTEEGLRTINAFLDSLLENSPTPVCVTDRNCRVETVNKAWEQTIGIPESETVGRYLHNIFDKETAHKLALANDAVLASNSSLEIEALIDSQTGAHHFHIVTFPLQDGGGNTNAVGSIFVDVTERKRAEEELTKNEAELRNKSVQLEEMNTALRVLLRQRASDQQEIEQRIVSNVREFVLPYVNKLKQMHPTGSQLSYIEIIEAHLNDIITPFLRQAVSMFPHMTAKELQVATLVREGRTNKDIADFMHVSLNTVELHRYNLRRKLGIQNKKVNLRSFLLSMSELSR